MDWIYIIGLSPFILFIIWYLNCVIPAILMYGHNVVSTPPHIYWLMGKLGFNNGISYCNKCWAVRSGPAPLEHRIKYPERVCDECLN